MKRNIQRIIGVTLAVLLLFGAVPTQSLSILGDLRLYVNAEDEVTSGTCGENLTWSYANGTLTIEGTGAMTDYAPNLTPWDSFCDEITTLELPDGLSHIGNYAFSKLAITKAAIPLGVVTVGDYAFGRCSSLEYILIPESVTQFGDYPLYRTGATEVICCPGSYAYSFSKYHNSFIGGTHVRVVSIYDKYPIQLEPSTGADPNANYSTMALEFDSRDEDNYKGNTFVFYDAELSWIEAKRVCEVLGGHLATVTGSEEMNALANNMPSGTLTGYWVGGVYDGANWKWVTDEPFNHAYWGTNEPNNLDREHCVELYREKKKLNNEAGTSTGRGFICEFEAYWEPVASVVDNNHLYMAFDESRIWDTCEDPIGENAPTTPGSRRCEKLGGHLVTITSEDENRIVTDLVKNQYKNVYWIGLTNTKKDNSQVWAWVTGEPYSSYHNWGDGEPSNGNAYGKENYVQIVAKNLNDVKTPGVWNNDYRYQRSNSNYELARTGFVCEIDLNTIPEPSASGYVGTHYYEVYDRTLCHYAAKAIAEQKGGHLLTLNSASEEDGVKNLCNAANLSKKRIWLGAKRNPWDAKEVYSWDTGERFDDYTAWLEGEPNNTYNCELFAEWDLDQNGWRDLNGFGGSSDYNTEGDCFVVEYDARTEPLTVVRPDNSEMELSVIGNTPFEMPTEFVKTGYTSELFRDAAYQSPWHQDEDSIVEPTTLYLKQTPNTYLVTLNPNGGTVHAMSKTITFDGKYGLLDTPMREGYDYDGWYTQLDGGELVNSDTPMQTANNHTLYAHWRASEYTVTFELNGGIVPAETVLSAQVTQNGTYSYFPQNPRKAGYTFDGWTLNGQNVALGDTVTIPGNHTITAGWRNRSIWNVQMQSPPTKTIYTADETFDPAGMLLQVIYDNGETESVEPVDYSKQEWNVGTCLVNVTYCGYAFPIQVTVAKGKPETAEILTNPNRLTYSVGETLDLTGMTLRIKYTGGVTEMVTEGFTASVATLTRVGTTRVTVYYEGIICGRVSVKTVQRSLAGISIQTPATKTIYTVGETLDTKGLTLSLQYSDGSAETISSGFTAQADLSEVGTHTVAVTYAVNDASYAAAYNVTVLPQPKLYAQTVTAQEDGEAVVAVMAENLPEHSTCFSLLLRYDPQVITPVSATAGPIIPFGENSCLSDSIGLSQSGLVKIVYLGSDDIPRNGELLNLTFHVDVDAIGEQIITWGTCTMEDDAGKTVNISGESIVINVDSSVPAKLNAPDTTAIVGKVVDIPVYLHGNNVSMLSMDVELDTTKARLVGVTAIEGTASLAGNHIDWSGTSRPGTPFIVLRVNPITSGQIPVTIQYALLENCSFVIAVKESQVAKIVPAMRITEGSDYKIVDITLSIRGNPGVMGFSVAVDYDADALQLATNGFAPELILKSGIRANTAEEGKLYYAWTSSGNLYNDLDIVQMQFIVPKAANPTTLHFSCDPNNTFNEAGESVVLECSDLILRDGFPGDANEDGNIDLKDVTIITRWIVEGWDVTINESNADVNTDGIVNLKDVVIIRRFLAGGWNTILE